MPSRSANCNHWCPTSRSAAPQSNCERTTPRPARWGFAIAAAVVILLLGGGVGWAILGGGSSSDNTSTTATTTAAAASASGTITTTTPQPPPDLLSLGGLTGLFAEMNRNFGDTLGYQLDIRSGRADLLRPDAVNGHKTNLWIYSDGNWAKLQDDVTRAPNI
jgi:hypothetical protein